LADPIRPSNWPIVPAAPQRPDPRAAAQKAFFALAMGQAPQEEAAQERPSAAPRRPDLHIELPSEPPQKVLRPGSIVDIRV
jgi:hypothetical protein